MTQTPTRSAIAAIACALAMILLPPAVRADDAARISFLESEIQRLRAQLGEQDRRIQRLEAELERHADAASPGSRPGRREETAATAGAVPSGPLPWHSPKAWKRLTIGMPQDEVEAILGEPTAVEAVDNYKTLFYSDAGTGGNSISGHVNLKDDLVVAIKKPATR